MTFSPKSLLSFASRRSILVDCLIQAGYLQSNNDLVLNSKKTETVIIAPPELHPNISQVIASFCSSVKSGVRDLSVIFGSSLGFDLHAKNISHSSFFILRNVSKLWTRVSSAEPEKTVDAFLSLHLDYCNALFICLDKSSFSRFQAIVNATARLRSHSRAHITPVSFSSHWLKLALNLSKTVARCRSATVPSAQKV